MVAWAAIGFLFFSEMQISRELMKLELGITFIANVYEIELIIDCCIETYNPPERTVLKE